MWFRPGQVKTSTVRQWPLTFSGQAAVAIMRDRVRATIKAGRRRAAEERDGRRRWIRDNSIGQEIEQVPRLGDLGRGRCELNLTPPPSSLIPSSLPKPRYFFDLLKWILGRRWRRRRRGPGPPTRGRHRFNTNVFAIWCDIHEHAIRLLRPTPLPSSSSTSTLLPAGASFRPTSLPSS